MRVYAGQEVLSTLWLLMVTELLLLLLITSLILILLIASIVVTLDCQANLTDPLVKKSFILTLLERRIFIAFISTAFRFCHHVLNCGSVTPTNDVSCRRCYNL